MLNFPARIEFPAPGMPTIAGGGAPISLDDARLFRDFERNLAQAEAAGLSFVHLGQTMTAAEALADIAQRDTLADAIAALATIGGEPH